jgi:signal transduction histidine kinase/CheY-like chemotaxis protein
MQRNCTPRFRPWRCHASEQGVKPGWLLFLLLSCVCLCASEPVRSFKVITSPSEVWGLPSEEKLLPHPLRIEGRITYYDSYWKMCWIEGEGMGAYLMLAEKAPPLRAGQYVRIEGSIIPGHGLSADLVRVTVLRNNDFPRPINIAGRINDLEALDCHVVSAEGYVDSQQYIDDDHLRLNMVVEERPVVAWVKPADVRNLPAYQGCFVRLTGLYSRRYDPSGNGSLIELWTNGEQDIQVVNTIAASPLFDRNVEPIGSLHGLPSGSQALVRGTVQSQDVDEGLILRDESGQVLVRSVQRQRLPVGSQAEAVGRVVASEGGWHLEGALYRHAAASASSSDGSTEAPRLDTILELRQQAMVNTRSWVRIAGSVAWSFPDSDFFFLQDITGGVRVHYSRSVMAPPPLLKHLQVEGELVPGPGQPVVELRSYTDRGALGAPRPLRMGYERAITGKEDGQWIQLRGYLRQVLSDGYWRSIYVMTPYGEFVCQLHSPVSLNANPGSLVRIQGICETQSDATGRITGLHLRTPFLHDVTVEEEAPVDLFDLPLRPVGSLSQLSLERDMLRVRVRGTVLRVSVGGGVQIQQDGAGVLLLGRENPRLKPGDEVEAVGILGAEGMHTVLREVVFRALGSHTHPEPLVVNDLTHPSRDLDGLLVRVRGDLVQVFDRLSQRSLTLQSGNLFYEASLDLDVHSAAPSKPAVGSGMELTGVCKLDFDDSRQVRSFHVLLRDETDLVVVKPARFLTLRRAIFALGSLTVLTLLASLWVAVLRRRVAVQTTQIRSQLEHQARMEAGVQHAARLESLGVLAGGIAHDFNNLLTIIIGNLSIASMNDEAMREVGDFIQEAQKGAGRAKELTQQLLTFAKGGSPVRTHCELGELLREIIRSTPHGFGIRIEEEIPEGLPGLSADRTQLSRAFHNIVLNALQAMTGGGLLRVSVVSAHLHAEEIPGLSAGAYLHVLVSDTGLGIPAEVLPRVFDPYFTTRSDGMGLGLTAAYSIIRKHEGHIDVDSAPGHGTRVHVWLPVPPTTHSLHPFTPKVSAATATKLGKVLLMDDEESIRKIVGLILARMGMEVVTASDGREAIELFRQARESGSAFNLLIFDLTVPGGMGGKDAMAAIRQIDLHTPAIVSSGYSDDPVMADYKQYGFTGVVPKPYELSELGEAIAKVLGKVS